MKETRRRLLEDRNLKLKAQSSKGLLSAFGFQLSFAFLFLASCLLFLPTAAHAEERNDIQKIDTVVIFPFENISGNFEAPAAINPLLEKELKSKGFKIIGNEDVDIFLSKRRIRKTSAIDRITAIELNRELGADAVVIGSIDLHSEVKGEVCVGLTVRLIGTRDCSIIWMDTVSHVGSDFKGLLGLGELKSLNKVSEVIVTSMVKKIPSEYSLDDKENNPFEIGNLKISPRIITSGKTAKISVRIIPITEKPVLVQSQIGGKVFDLRSENGDYYEGELTIPDGDGLYPIDIVADASDGKICKFSSVDVLRVDSKPPRVTISTNKDITSGFTKKDSILFTLKSDEDIEKWDVEITDADNRYVRGGKGFGVLPVELIWRGENDAGGKINDGAYKLKLSVWDAAGNMGVFQKDVMLDTTPPSVKISAETTDNGEVVFNLDYNNDEAMEKWEFAVLGENLKAIKNLNGKGNVARQIIIPSSLVENESAGGKIIYTFKAVDSAGNTFETSNNAIIFADKRENRLAKKMERLLDWGKDF
jgi:hypothetical protein